MTRLNLFVAAVLASASTSAAFAGTVTLDSTARGGFGAAQTDGSDFVLGYTFLGAGAIEISATGTIDLSVGHNLFATPDGISLDRPGAHLGANEVFPLEEQLVDGGATLPLGTAHHVGALLGAFVPDSLASDPSFLPRNDDLTAVGISSQWIFLIGSGPFTFTTSQAGRLYLGVNDTYPASNNSGSFEVTLVAVPVPLPPAAWMGVLVMGSTAVIRRLRRRRSRSAAPF